jgi:putative tryptophan/tyrosine transport system substrate-binding protein
MKRRDVIAALGGAASLPLAARAQEPRRTYRIGFLAPVLRDSPAMAAFLDELRINGFVEGQNVAIIAEGFGARKERLAELATAIVNSRPDAIVGGPEQELRALQAATRTIPLLGMSEDMVAAGLVASLSRPSGNITGLSILSPELDGKRLDILAEAVPSARRIAAFADSNVTSPQHLQRLRDAARERNIELMIFGVGKRGDVLRTIDEAKGAGAEAISFLASPLFAVNAEAFLAHLAALRLPSMYQWPENAEQGALVAYGPRLIQVFRQRARMLVKVLRGTKPADLPVEQPTTFELVINLKIAKVIGHEVPAGLVLRADKLIE